MSQPETFFVKLDWQGRQVEATVRHLAYAYGVPYPHWKVESATYGTGEAVAGMPGELRLALIDDADRQRWLLE